MYVIAYNKHERSILHTKAY